VGEEYCREGDHRRGCPYLRTCKHEIRTHEELRTGRSEQRANADRPHQSAPCTKNEYNLPRHSRKETHDLIGVWQYLERIGSSARQIELKGACTQLTFYENMVASHDATVEAALWRSQFTATFSASTEAL
jgi:hypothetical protein